MGTENLGYIEGLGEIHRIYAPFHKQLKDFIKIGIGTPVSIRDASLIRLNAKSTEGTRTCHAPVYFKDSPTIIARISPLVKDLTMAEQAVNAHKKAKDPVFDSKIYGQWEKIAKQDKGKKPEKRRAIVLSERNDFDIHKHSDEAEFFWQDASEEYFDKFVSSGEVRVYQIDPETIDSANGTIVNYVWFDDPVVGSGLGLRGRGLDGGGAFGVLKKTPKRGSQKILGKLVRPYTQREIDKIYKTIESVKSGNLPASKLEKALKFLEKLK